MIATIFADTSTIKELHTADCERITYPPSILIVADDACQAFTLKQKLENNGCLVHCTDTGFGNLTADCRESFDLIVLDIEHRKVDDIELGKKLKTDPELADIPVIMLATRTGSTKTVTGAKLPHPTCYIFKGESLEARLLQVIEQIHYMTYRYM